MPGDSIDSIDDESTGNSHHTIILFDDSSSPYPQHTLNPSARSLLVCDLIAWRGRRPRWGASVWEVTSLRGRRNSSGMNLPVTFQERVMRFFSASWPSLLRGVMW